MSEKKYIKEQKLRDLDAPELRKRVDELKAQEYQHRFDRVTGKLENYRLILQNRRRTAVLLTLLRGKELTAQKGGK